MLKIFLQTNYVSEYIKERDQVFKSASKSEDKALWKRGVNLRKQIITMVKEARRTYVQENLIKHAKNSEKFWQSVQLVKKNLNHPNYLRAG